MQDAVQGTFLHELGHAVGLGHVYDQEGSAVMGNMLSRGTLYDFLFADDIAGIRATLRYTTWRKVRTRSGPVACDNRCT